MNSGPAGERGLMSMPQEPGTPGFSVFYDPALWLLDQPVYVPGTHFSSEPIFRHIELAG